MKVPHSTPAVASLAMRWSDVFLVFVVSHLVGDFLFQTGWQARNKFSALGGGGKPLALLAHGASYLVAFIPAAVWLGVDGRPGVWSVGLAALVVVPHVLQDDGRLLIRYIRVVKRSPAAAGDRLFVMVDQSFHILALFGVALLAAA